jgi:hypothetical protein
LPSYFLPPSAIAFSPSSSRLANGKKVYELLPKPSGKIGNAGAHQVSSLCATHHMSRCGGKRFEFCNTLLKSVKHRCPSLFQPHPRSSGSTDFMPVQPLRAQTRYVQLPMAVTPDVKRFSQVVHKPKVRPFFGPRVSHFLKVRTAELLATINIMKCAKYDHSHLHFLPVFFLTHLRNCW